VSIPPGRLGRLDENDLAALFQSCQADRQSIARRIAVADDAVERVTHSVTVHFRWLGFHLFLSLSSLLLVPITDGLSLLLILGDSVLIWNELNELFADRAETILLRETARVLRTEARELDEMLDAIDDALETHDLPE
jgi:hypothetical protein